MQHVREYINRRYNINPVEFIQYVIETIDENNIGKCIKRESQGYIIHFDLGYISIDHNEGFNLIFDGKLLANKSLDDLIYLAIFLKNINFKTGHNDLENLKKLIAKKFRKYYNQIDKKIKEDISKLHHQNNKEKQQEKKVTIVDFRNVQNKIYESLQNYCSNTIKISEEFSIILKWKQNTEPKIEYTPYTIVITFSKKDEKFQAEISLYVNSREIYFQEISKIIQGKDFKFIVCKVMECIKKLLDVLKCKYNLSNLQIKTIQIPETGKKIAKSCVQPKFSTYNAEISINDEWIKRELAKGYNRKAIINQIGRKWR